LSENWVKQLSPVIKQAWDDHINGISSIDKSDISDRIKVTVSKDKVVDKYNINISIGREVIVDGRLGEVMDIVENDIELRLAEL